MPQDRPTSPRRGRRTDTASLGLDFVAEMGRLGLAPNETRIYLALLRRPMATAAELAEAAGIPRTKAYQALDALERRGFSTGITGAVARFRAVAPTSALQTWTAYRDHERELAREQEHALAAVLAERLAGHCERAEASPVTELESVSGRARTTETLERLINSASSQLLAVHQPPYLQPPSRWNRGEIAAAQRGVEVRVILGAEALNDKRRYRGLTEAGVATMVLDRPAMKLVLRDGAEAMIAPRDPLTGEQGITSMIIRHPDLVEALRLLFDKEWDSATPLKAQDTG